MTPPITTLREKLEQLAEPDKGIRYTNGRASGTYDHELTAFGPTARSLFWILEHAEELLRALEGK